jgi:hypothetical protein
MFCFITTILGFSFGWCGFLKYAQAQSPLPVSPPAVLLGLSLHRHRLPPPFCSCRIVNASLRYAFFNIAWLLLFGFMFMYCLDFIFLIVYELLGFTFMYWLDSCTAWICYLDEFHIWGVKKNWCWCKSEHSVHKTFDLMKGYQTNVVQQIESSQFHSKILKSSQFHKTFVCNILKFSQFHSNIIKSSQF